MVRACLCQRAEAHRPHRSTDQPASRPQPAHQPQAQGLSKSSNPWPLWVGLVMELWERFPPSSHGAFILDSIEALTGRRVTLAEIQQQRQQKWLPEKRARKKNHVLVFGELVWRLERAKKGSASEHRRGGSTAKAV